MANDSQDGVLDGTGAVDEDTMLLRLDEKRFFAKIFFCTVTGCWLWTASTNAEGYGCFWVGPSRRGGKCQLAHRASFELHVGPIPGGLVLDHLCRVRHCVNPEHLRAVTQRENVHAAGSEASAHKQAGRTCCPRGHAHAKWNSVASAARGGKRSCLACSRAGAWGRYYGLGLDSELVRTSADVRYEKLRSAA